MVPLLVIDASAALALLLAEDEGRDTAELLQSIFAQNGQLYVPEIFWYEVCNGLLSAERQDRIDPYVTKAALAELGRMPFVCYSNNEEPFLSGAVELARKHNLSFYDASYLELALRYRAQLKSYDSHLLSLKREYPNLII